MSETNLKEKHCEPCHGKTQPLKPETIQNYLKQLSGWQLSEDKKEISKNFQFKDFSTVLKYVNAIGNIAEKEDHHPDLYIHSYRKLRIQLSTHAVGGLSDNDFILAAKIDAILPS